ncbi:hypothetical protein N7468_009712 [Penicillium chermesinum]|uniref:Uncharacterized protein n=1 Tax=Penicillium chermesinum TaxID=63820 RepID=A0A9W9NKX3_9EURO|nr:uncharacterized protein N7468_009712 [Penicillium chermesinum]KAJ5220508.1 hypothetical protein N7468_009712 [Penicillium chermesinum]
MARAKDRGERLPNLRKQRNFLRSLICVSRIRSGGDFEDVSAIWRFPGEMQMEGGFNMGLYGEWWGPQLELATGFFMLKPTHHPGDRVGFLLAKKDSKETAAVTDAILEISQRPRRIKPTSIRSKDNQRGPPDRKALRVVRMSGHIRKTQSELHSNLIALGTHASAFL